MKRKTLLYAAILAIPMAVTSPDA
ncbi:MAG: hypothetical protein HW389_1133, partial [Bacteroidetes bacterium]|nr:hypothetical protein [Bacteroidota bacterium]